MGYTPCPCDTDLLDKIDHQVVYLADVALNNLKYGLGEPVLMGRFKSLKRIRKALEGSIITRKSDSDLEKVFDRFKTYLYQ